MTSEAFITKQYFTQKPANSEALALSVVISPASFMYSVSTQNFSHVIELCHLEITHSANASFDLTEKITFVINNYLLHQRKFQKVNIALLNHDFTLIPVAYGNEQDIKPLLEFSTGAEKIKRSFKHTLRNINFCFALEQDLVGYLERTFPNASIRHLGAVTIDLLFNQHSLLNCDLYLSIGDGFIELAAKEKNDLLFYNVFSYETNEDILYYLLFMMEQFHMNPLHVRLAIAAQREVSDDLIKNIKKYIKQVNFCVLDPSVKFIGEHAAATPKHYYFTLLNQHLCEL